MESKRQKKRKLIGNTKRQRAFQFWVFSAFSFVRKGDFMKTNILIIDDDLAVCKQIKYNLQSEVINVYYAMSVKDALLFLAKNNCSLIILELRHSEADGTELLHAIRARNPVPVLVLSYDGSLEHKTKAFKGGADDFLVKPFVTEECLLRAQALIRRYTELNPMAKRSYTIVSFEDLTMNNELRKVFLRNKEVKLTSKEFGILQLLISNPDRVYTYEQIFESVWNDSYIGDKRRVISHISELRKKLDKSDCIKSVHDVGYKLNDK